MEDYFEGSGDYLMDKLNKKPQVMVLGTFHMRYTQDLYRVEFDNLLSPKRQEEIRKVVNVLINYNPTKIALEVVKEKDNLLNEEYQQYVNGQLELKVDEIHQFGFRTAAELTHKNIYAVDWMESVGNRAISQVLDWAKIEQPELSNFIDEEYISKHQRNLIIYSNLAEITSLSSDRTLLIIGSAHVYLISQFLKESGLFDVVTLDAYFVKIF